MNTSSAWHKSSRSGASNCVEVAWRKSSRSGVTSNCVEVAWRKSSHSGTASNCVEVALAQQAAVRDSKSPERTLSFPIAAWSTFLTALG